MDIEGVGSEEKGGYDQFCQELGCKVGNRAGTEEGCCVSELHRFQAELVHKKFIDSTEERDSGTRVSACWV